MTLRLDDVRVLGTAARPWPEPGCRCVTCRGGTTGAPVGLDVGGPLPDLPAGSRTVRGGVRVAGLPGALVLADGTGTWLWSPGTGPLPPATLDALAGAGLTAAFVDVRDATGRAAAEHAAHRLADLRRAGALAPAARVVAVGLGHEGPDVRRLAADLAGHGVAVVRPGRWADVDPGPPAVPPRPPRTLVLGPASSGKSRAAEALLAAEPAVVYAATGPAPGDGDPEWAAKVAAHRGRRPAGWVTVEAGAPGALAALLAEPGPPVLLDSLGTWAAAALDRAGAWQDDAAGAGWRDRVDEEVAGLVDAWRRTTRDVVAVGEEVGWGVVPATRSGRVFATVLGDLHRELAGQAERVLLVVAGRVLPLDAPPAALTGGTP